MTSLLLADRVGSQAPRISNVPPGSEAAGEESVELADIAGLRLDEWQQLVLRGGMRQTGQRWSASRIGCWVPRQNGKGGVIEARVLAGLFLLREPLIIWSAHQYNTAQEGFLRIRGLIEQTPDLHRQVRRYWTGTAWQGIELHTGERLRFLARSRTSGRGFTGRCNILDEAQELTPAQVAAIFPTVSAQPNPQLWMFGTPPTDQAAWCYGLKADGEVGRPRLAWFDWGGPDWLLDDRDAWGDRDWWYATNPAAGIRIFQSTIEDEHGASGLGDQFPHERLGVWRPRATSGSGVIPSQLWADLAAPPEQRPAEVTFALVVNQHRTVAYIAYAGRDEGDPEGMVRLGLADRLTDVSRAPARLLELRERHNPVGLSVKARSESLLLDLQRAGLAVPDDPEQPRRGDLHVPSAAQDAAATGLLLDAARSQRVRHAADLPVDTALDEAKLRPSAGGVTWDDKAGDMAPLRAVCHALWLFESWAHLVAGDYDALANIY